MSKHSISGFEDQGELHSFLKSDPDLAEVSSQILRGLEAIGPLPSEADPEQAFIRLQTRIGSGEAQASKTLGKLHRWVGYGITAGLLVLVASLVSIRQIGLPFNRSDNSPVELSTYATSPGKRAKIDLPDGSTVSLSVASRIRYGKNFGKSSRDIYLEGEAYFEVPRNTSGPFVVRTGNTITRVLGTSFGVRQYEGEPSVRVMVNAGKVQVKSSAAERVVAAGEAVQANAGTISMIPINPSAIAWMRGEMVFVKTPLAEVVKEMERWYGINVQLDDPTLGRAPVTATLGSQTPQDAIRIVTMMFGARTINNGNTITIYRR